MASPDYHQQIIISDDSADTNYPDNEENPSVQTYVMNFLSDDDTNDRETVIHIGQNEPLIGANECEAAKTKPKKRRQRQRNLNPPGQRRTRIKYTPEQLAILEEAYQHSKYINTDDRIELAEQMNLDPICLRFWWRNRRQKDSDSGSKPVKIYKRKTKPPKVCQSTSAAPTPSPTPPNFSSSSCSVDQWQSSTNQPTHSQVYDASPPPPPPLQYQDPYLIPYQEAPAEYMTHSNHYPYDESNLFSINQHMDPYSYASEQYNGLEMYNYDINATNENFTPTMMMEGGYFSHSSDPYTQFDQKMNVIPLDLTQSNQFDGGNASCTEMDSLMGYWQQMRCEFSDYNYIPLDQ